MAPAGRTMTCFSVALQDANGNNIASASASVGVTLSVFSGPGTLLGTTTALTSTSGPATATFTNVNIQTAGTYRLLAGSSAGGFRTDTSAIFTVTAGPASRVNFVTLPSNIVAG